jgi:hypothetical protein
MNQQNGLDMASRSSWEDQLKSNGYFDGQGYMLDQRSEAEKLVARREAQSSWLVHVFWMGQFERGVSSIFSLWIYLMMLWWRFLLTAWFRHRAIHHKGTNQELLASFRRDTLILTSIAMVAIVFVGVVGIGGALLLLLLGRP